MLLSPSVTFCVFPARAGMILPSPNEFLSMAGIPRESGDDPDGKFAIKVAESYSPRERG